MIEASPTLLRIAGYSAALAIPALIASAVALALFFGGAGQIWGPINDLFVALTLGLLALPIVALAALLGERTGAWFPALSLVAIVGLAVAAGGQLLLVAGIIRLETSFVSGGIGILPLLAWCLALAVVALNHDGLADLVGWLLIAVLVATAVTAIGAAALSGPALLVLAGALIVALVAWLAALSAELFRHAAA